jgi:hypothetical protein
MAEPNNSSGPSPRQAILPDQDPEGQHRHLERILLLQRGLRTGAVGAHGHDAGPVEPGVGLWQFGVVEGSVESSGGIDY